MEKFLDKFYLRKPPLKDEQKKKIFDLASIENDTVLPLKLNLIVNYLNDNNVKTIDKLLNDANAIKRQHIFFLNIMNKYHYFKIFIKYSENNVTVMET